MHMAVLEGDQHAFNSIDHVIIFATQEVDVATMTEIHILAL